MKLKKFTLTSLATLLMATSLSAQTFTYDFVTDTTTSSQNMPGSPFNNTGWTDWSNNHQSLSSNHSPIWNQYIQHGVYDDVNDGFQLGENVGGVITSFAGRNFQATAVHNTASYDLSVLGSSVTIQQWWNPSLMQTGRGAATSVNELTQIGLLTDTSATFRDTTKNSFYVGGLETAHNKAASTTNLTHNIYDQDGNATLSIADATVNAGTAFSKSLMYEYTIKFTNAGAGKFDVDVDIDQWGLAAFNTAYTELNGSFLNGSNTNVSHSFTNTELSNLKVGLGMRIADSTVISGSGTNYDSLSTEFTSVPEPSTSLLTGLALSLGLLRRSRK